MAGGSVVGEISPSIAFIFVYNLVIGVGGLALPLAFSKSGIVLSSIFLCFLGLLAYVTLTFVIEALAAANFIRRRTGSESATSRLLTAELEENNDAHLSASAFEIRERVEMGELATLFLGPRGTAVFYFLLCIYLIGDLLICTPISCVRCLFAGMHLNFAYLYVRPHMFACYDPVTDAVSVPLTLAKFFGEFTIGSWHVSQDESYYFFLALFAMCILPFCFMSFQNTRPLQLFCMAMRNMALIMMISLAFLRITHGESASSDQLVWAQPSALPALYGVCYLVAAISVNVVATWWQSAVG
jgi:hypothetical protein